MKRGFTLLELLVVLAISGLITGIAVVRLHGPYRAARLEEQVGRLQFVDCQTRLHARGADRPCQLVFDMEKGRFYSQEKGGDSTRHFEMTLPGSVRLLRVKTSRTETNRGMAEIDISRRGASPTYAVCIGTAEPQKRWLFFCGLTGQVTHLKDEMHAHQLFKAALQAPRLDTD